MTHKFSEVAMIRDYVTDSDSDHNAKESPESPSPVEVREIETDRDLLA